MGHGFAGPGIGGTGIVEGPAVAFCMLCDDDLCFRLLLLLDAVGASAATFSDLLAGAS